MQETAQIQTGWMLNYVHLSDCLEIICRLLFPWWGINECLRPWVRSLQRSACLRDDGIDGSLNGAILGKYSQISQVMFVPDTDCLRLPPSLFSQNMQFSIICCVFIWLLFCGVQCLCVRCPLLLLCFLHTTTQSPCWIGMENTFYQEAAAAIFRFQILEIRLCFNSNRRISKVRKRGNQ